MSNPTPPTVEQLNAEIADLKKQIAGMVPSAEKTALQEELEAVKKERDALKAAASAPPEKTGFFPKLF